MTDGIRHDEARRIAAAEMHKAVNRWLIGNWTNEALLTTVRAEIGVYEERTGIVGGV